MALTSLGENAVNTSGDLPAVGTKAPDFILTLGDFSEVSRTDGVRTVLNIFMSVDTGVCSKSVRTFNEIVAGLDNTQVICVSGDLPWAIRRFCGAEDIDNVVTASAFRSSFATDYGVLMVDGLFRGATARAIVVLDTDGTVLYANLEPAIGVDPDIDAAIAVLS